MRSRPREEEGALAAAGEHAGWPLVELKEIQPVVHARFPLTQAAEAHRLMESGSHIGKIVLTV
jgi:NADPH2:quinone reductase